LSHGRCHEVGLRSGQISGGGPASRAKTDSFLPCGEY
jgi:hypothetical protein